MVSNILVNINVATPASSSGSWANITDMAVSGITVQGTNSVLLLMAQVQLDPATDNTAEFRFYVNGSETNSPVITAFSDGSSNEEAQSMTLVWAITGLSGSSNSFSVQWKTITGSPVADQTRNRTFQILEIVGGDATIKVDSGTTGQIGDPSSWGNLFQTTGVSIAGTSSVILMLANVPINMEADEAIDFQFGVDNSGEGAVTTGMTDNSNEGNGWSGMHVLDGLSTGDHSFELKWQARSGAGQTDSSRRRTFQVVEITANAALKLDLISSTSEAAAVEWANVPGLSNSYGVAATTAIHLLIGNMQQLGAGDSTIDFSIGVDGVNEGAELIGFSDSTVITHRICMPRLKTGLSVASHSFQLRWQDIANGDSDSGRARTFFAIEFTQAPPINYKLEGVTYNKSGVALGSVKCFLYKDNGAAPVTYVDYVLSHVTTGAYSFTNIADNDPNYIVVGTKADTPHVFDVTDHNLLPKETPDTSYDLYLRSDSDRGESSPDPDLRMRSQASKIGATNYFEKNSDVCFKGPVSFDKTSDVRYFDIFSFDKTSDVRYLDIFYFEKNSDVRFKGPVSFDKTSDVCFKGPVSFDKNSDVRYLDIFSFDKNSGVTFFGQVSFNKNSDVRFLDIFYFDKNSNVAFFGQASFDKTSDVNFSSVTFFLKNSDVRFKGPVSFNKTSDVKFIEVNSFDKPSDVRFLDIFYFEKNSNVRFQDIIYFEKTSDVDFFGQVSFDKNSDVRFLVIFSFDKTSDVRYLDIFSFDKNSAVWFKGPVSFDKTSDVRYFDIFYFDKTSDVKFITFATNYFDKNSDVKFVGIAWFTKTSDVRFEYDVILELIDFDVSYEKYPEIKVKYEKNPNIDIAYNKTNEIKVKHEKNPDIQTNYNKTNEIKIKYEKVGIRR